MIDVIVGVRCGQGVHVLGEPEVRREGFFVQGPLKVGGDLCVVAVSILQGGIGVLRARGERRGRGGRGSLVVQGILKFPLRGTVVGVSVPSPLPEEGRLVGVWSNVIICMGTRGYLYKKNYS